MSCDAVKDTRKTNLEKISRSGNLWKNVASTAILLTRIIRKTNIKLLIGGSKRNFGYNIDRENLDNNKAGLFFYDNPRGPGRDC